MSDQFASPASAVGVVWADLRGALLIIKPDSVEKVLTSFGESDCVRADVSVVDGEQAGEIYRDTLIFPKVLQSQVRSTIGTGRMVLGRLGQGNAKAGQSPPWRLEDPTAADKKAAQAFLTSTPAPVSASASASNDDIPF